MTAPVYLFDISAYLHRAMYVTYGDRCAEIDPNDDAFIKHASLMLANTMGAINVRRMAVVCDSTEPSWRCDVFPAYKAERKPHYPVFTAQVPRFFDALLDISVAIVCSPRYEADDLIASIVNRVAGDHVIVSSDKDLLALVKHGTFEGDSQVKFYDPMKGVWSNPGDVKEKFGVEPSQLYDYIGLVGDTSDGIPGVEGFGAKTAAKLLREFDSLDEIYSPERREALAEHVSKKRIETLLASEEIAFLSRRLASPWFWKEMPASTAANFEAPDPSIIRRCCG